jgi:hypothetical protein
MQFRIGGTGMRKPGPFAGIGCGGMLAVVGLILISPVGEWLIKGIGWVLIAMGGFIVVTGVYLWIRGPRPGRFF